LLGEMPGSQPPIEFREMKGRRGGPSFPDGPDCPL
jgi:hypothetical protein